MGGVSSDPPNMQLEKEEKVKFYSFRFFGSFCIRNVFLKEVILLNFLSS